MKELSKIIKITMPTIILGVLCIFFAFSSFHYEDKLKVCSKELAEYSETEKGKNKYMFVYSVSTYGEDFQTINFQTVVFEFDKINELNISKAISYLKKYLEKDKPKTIEYEIVNLINIIKLEE